MSLFKMRFILAVIFAFLNLPVNSQQKDTQHHCNTMKKIQKMDGDLIIGGLFPVHVEKKNGDQRYMDLNYYALTWTEAMLYAMDEIKNSSSLLSKYTLGFDIRDSCNQVHTALEVALDFVLNARDIEQKSANGSCKCAKGGPAVGAVIGGAASPISTNVAYVFSVNDIPQISYSSTSVLLSNKAIYPSFLRTIPSDTYQAKAIADMLDAFQWNYVSVVASDSAYGRAGMDALKDELKKRKICVAIDAIFHPDLYKNELQRIINSLKSKPRAKVIVLWCQRPNAIGFLLEATRLGLKGRTWIGTETWGDSYLLESLDPATIGGMIGVVPHLTKHSGFEAHLLSLDPGNSRRNPWLSEFWQKQFDCHVHKSAGDSSIEDTDNHFVYKPNNGDNVTIVCPKSRGLPTTNRLPRNKYTNVMDAVYAVAHAIDSILRCKNNGSHCPSAKPFIRPKDLLHHIKNISFTGRSDSVVSFDRNGDLMYGSYAIKSLQPNESDPPRMMFTQIGSWEGLTGKLTISSDARFLWNGWRNDTPISRCNDICGPGTYAVNGSSGCCWQCVMCPAGFAKRSRGLNYCTRCPEGFESNSNRTHCIETMEDYMKWTSMSAVSVVILSVFGIIITSFVFGVFFKHRGTAVVKASNRELSFIHLASICLTYIFPFILIGKPTPGKCGVQPFYFAVIFSLGTSIMLLKTDRLLRIFRARSRLSSRSHLLTNRMQILTACAMTSLPVGIAVIWFIIRPPEVTIKELSANRRVINCGDSVHSVQLVILIYILVLALVCTYFAYRARSLPENFNEAKFIGFAMFSFCIFWMSFMPAFYGSAEANRMLILCLAILASAYSVLGIMYFPKVRVIIFYPSRNSTEIFRINAMTMASRGQSQDGSPTIGRPSPLPSPIENRRPVTPSLSPGLRDERRMSAITLGRTIYT